MGVFLCKQEEDAEGGGEAAHRESLHCRPEIVYPSWVWGPHLTYKLRVLAPLGILFGLKYGVTNWGLQLVPTPVHVLLQVRNAGWLGGSTPIHIYIGT